MNPNFKSSKFIKLLSFCLILLVFTNCKKDSSSNNAPTITLDAEAASGQGQYTVNHELAPNAEPITINVSVSNASAIQSFTITKTVNLVADPSYGTNGVLTVNPSEISSGQYTFTYSPTGEDANKLVGFKFKAVANGGAVGESDLTLNVSFTPAGNLPYKKWKLNSIVFVNGDPANEDITEDCNKDDVLDLDVNGECVYDYGALSCNIFEPFDTPLTWELSEDNKTFTLYRLSGFTNQITPQVYTVKELTLNTLKIELVVDMTGLGGGPNDTFLYTYTAIPK